MKIKRNERLLSYHGIFPLRLWNLPCSNQSSSEIAKKWAPLSKAILKLYEEISQKSEKAPIIKCYRELSN